MEDNNARDWAAHVRDKNNMAHHFLEKPAMYGQLPDISGLKVLCVGCGSGEECEYLRQKGAKVTGVDLSAELIEIAKRSYSGINFQVMDMHKLAFGDNTFDLIYSSLALHYSSNVKDVLLEINRILKDGGTFLFSAEHPVYWSAEAVEDSKGSKSRLLGYTKNYADDLVQIYGDYLNGQITEKAPYGSSIVSAQHRPLSATFRDIRQTGFEVLDFIEPKPIEKAKEIDPNFYELHSKIPLFMIFKLKKSQTVLH